MPQSAAGRMSSAFIARVKRLLDCTSGLLAMDVSRGRRLRNSWTGTLTIVNVLLITMEMKGGFRGALSNMEDLVSWLSICVFVAPSLCLLHLQGNHPRQSLWFNVIPILILAILLLNQAQHPVSRRTA